MTSNKTKLTLSVNSKTLARVRKIFQDMNISDEVERMLEQRVKSKKCDKCNGTGLVFEK